MFAEERCGGGELIKSNMTYICSKAAAMSASRKYGIVVPMLGLVLCAWMVLVGVPGIWSMVWYPV